MKFKFTITRNLEVQVADIVTIDANTQEEAEKLAQKNMENHTLCPELSTNSESSFIADYSIDDYSLMEYDWD
ncbi:MAG: hypothetical protein QNK23_15480 [Crocinitomicaceae bacterium]|nr:hypothetical protein [Crocinitomicaceae bacterium]